MASGSGTEEVTVGDIIDSIPVDARDGLIQVIKVGDPWKFVVQYAPGSDDEMDSTLHALSEKFTPFKVEKYKTLVVLRDKE